MSHVSTILAIYREQQKREGEAMTAQSDVELFDWLINAADYAGDFLKALARAGLRADDSNYPVLRPVLLVMAAKYPKYARGER